MYKENTISALINAVERGKGYTFTVHSVKCVNGMVYIGIDEPGRTVTMTERVYDKIKDYIVVAPPKSKAKSQWK